MAYNGNGKNNTRTFVNEFKIKEQLCDVGRRIWLKGFCAGNEGNHSYRIGDNKFLCTPTGISKGNLKPDDEEADAQEQRLDQRHANHAEPYAADRGCRKRDQLPCPCRAAGDAGQQAPSEFDTSLAKDNEHGGNRK